MNHRTATRTAPVHADQLRDAVAADPAAPVAAAIQGAGGHGKTTLLGDLAGTYRSAGVTVRDVGNVPPPERAGEAVVLVDDAHRLDEATLSRLHDLSDRPDARLVVTYRPWPRVPALAALIGNLGRSSPPIQLGSLTGAALAEQARVASDRTLTAERVGHLHALTGGVPRLVARVLTVPDFAAAGDPGHESGSPAESGIPRAVLDRFHHDLDELSATGRGCLAALSVGAPAQPALLAGLLDASTDVAGEGLAEVRACGLLDPGDAVVPLARQAVLALTAFERRVGLVRDLAAVQLERGAPVLPLVRPLLGAETALVGEPALATAFERAGDEASQHSPRLAVRLFDAAVSAGAAAATVGARRARAAAVAGDLDEALRTADQVIVDDAVPDRELGVQVSATVLANRGLVRRAAELCRWSVGNARWPGDVAFAVVGLLASGSGAEAADLMRSSTDAGPPTSLSGATTQLAEGMCESVSGSAATAVSTLVRAASLAGPLGTTMLVPDTPAAVAALVALHSGEFDVADSVLERAVQSGSGGPLARARHSLLAAWGPLLRGDTLTARRRLHAVAEDGAHLELRDHLVAVALEAGIASRDNDTAALSAVRGRARKAVAEHPADLFTLLPLGELVVASARLGDRSWLAPYLREAWSVLSDLGSPPLWSALLHWKCVQAAVVLEEHDEIRDHASALEAMAGHTPLTSALGEAARTWSRIQSGDVDRVATERAARSLHAAGMAGDGANLAGQAAIRSSDRKVMLELLECARSLQGKGTRPQKIGGVDVGAVLSDREREVAELVLAGMTYKQVGKRLFISAKTVEHHIGRIKQRLGCADREELLTRLRGLLDQHGS